MFCASLSHRLSSWFLLAALLALGLSAATTLRAQEDAAVPQRDLSDGDYGRLVAVIVDDHIRPSYDGFEAAASLLSDNMSRLCEAPDPAGEVAVLRAFDGTVRSFASLIPVEIGPILEEHRLERLAFWPDPRGIGLKQVTQILNGRDETALSPSGLVGKSVSVQGLTALDYLLSGEGREALLAKDDPAGAFRCRFGQAIAGNVATIAAEMASAWARDGAATRLLQEPSPSNPLFQTHKEVASKIFNQLSASLEVIVENMITVPFGATVDKRKPKLAPFWRSHLSLPATMSAVQSALHLFEVAGLEHFVDERERWLVNSVQFELRNTAQSLDKVGDDILTASEDPKDRTVIAYVQIALHSLKRSISRDVTAALGLEQGFNANDGD